MLFDMLYALSPSEADFILPQLLHMWCYMDNPAASLRLDEFFLFHSTHSQVRESIKKIKGEIHFLLMCY
jgi:hypothetical protein